MADTTGAADAAGLPAKRSSEAASDPATKKQRSDDTTAVSLGAWPVDEEATFAAVVTSLLAEEGVSWNTKLRRGTAPQLRVPGVLTQKPVPAGELLCVVPARLHFSRPCCQQALPAVYAACEVLPSADPEKREEAADALCMAHLLLDARERRQGAEAFSLVAASATIPKLWRCSADSLLGLAEDFSQSHPYIQALHGSGAFQASAEPELVAAQAQYVRTVFRCMREKLDERMLPSSLDEGLFLLAWLCLLTRRFSGPEGSVLVPGVDFLNHSSQPGASSDWDEDSGAVVVRALRDLGEGEEVCICYGSLSNPLLWRTYGFTLSPLDEPVWSCTFTDEEVLSAGKELKAPDGVLEELESLPNLHLVTSFVSDELAAMLQALASQEVSPAHLLRQVCEQRLARVAMLQDPALASMLEALHSTGMAALTSVEKDAHRVRLSEYLCLLSHLEALDALEGREVSSAEGRRALPADLTARTEDLRSELRAIQKAGMLGLTVQP